MALLKHETQNGETTKQGCFFPTELSVAHFRHNFLQWQIVFLDRF